MSAHLAYPLDLVGDGVQPGPAIFVGERMPGAHLLDIAFRVKPVTVLEAPVQSFGKLACHRGFAGTGYAHDDQGARCLAEFITHENSPAMPRDPPATSSRQRKPHAPPEDLRQPARASISRACPRRRPRTAFHGMSQARAM